MIQEPPRCNEECPSQGLRLKFNLPCCRVVRDDDDPLPVDMPPHKPVLTGNACVMA